MCTQNAGHPESGKIGGVMKRRVSIDLRGTRIDVKWARKKIWRTPGITVIKETEIEPAYKKSLDELIKSDVGDKYVWMRLVVENK